MPDFGIMNKSLTIVQALVFIMLWVLC